MPLSNNPAYDRLLADDRSYHMVFLVVGGAFTLMLLCLFGYSWMLRRRAARRTVARRTHTAFALASATLLLMMAVALYANWTSVANPGETLAGTTFSPAGQAWLDAGRAELSPVLRHAIDERLAWQRPKAVICTVLLAAFVWLTVYLFRSLIRRSATGAPVGRLRLAGGILSAVAAFILMLMVIGNAEGAIAPLTLTAIYG